MRNKLQESFFQYISGLETVCESSKSPHKNKIKMKIWGREFKLDFVYDCYEGEEILESQIAALYDFIKYMKSKDAMNKSLDKVKDYILSDDENDLDKDTIDNIFKYVIPKSIFIYREKGSIALLCDYKFDNEHGLAVFFKNGKCVKVCSQSSI